MISVLNTIPLNSLRFVIEETVSGKTGENLVGIPAQVVAYGYHGCNFVVGNHEFILLLYFISDWNSDIKVQKISQITNFLCNFLIPNRRNLSPLPKLPWIYTLHSSKETGERSSLRKV